MESKLGITDTFNYFQFVDCLLDVGKQKEEP